MSVFQVVKRSAQLFWRNKFLWWLGILPGFLVGVVGAFSNVLGVDGEEILWMHRDWASLAVFVQEKVNFNIWIVLGIFLLFITAGVFSALMTLSTYRAAAQLYQGHERESIWRLLSRSRKQFWSWLGLPLVAGLMLSVSLLPVGGLLVLGGAIMTQTSVNPVLIFWLVFALVCFILLILVIFGTVLQQGKAALVIEGLPAFDAFDRSYLLVKKSFFMYLIVGLIFGLFSLGIWAATVLPFTADLLPALPATIAEIDWLDLLDQLTAYRDLEVETLRPLYLWPVVIVLEGLLGTFGAAFWTVLFLEKREIPKVEEVFDTMIELSV